MIVLALPSGNCLWRKCSGWVSAIIEFSKNSDEPLELLINNKPIGLGVTVKVGENFGLKISQIGDVKQVIRSLGENGV